MPTPPGPTPTEVEKIFNLPEEYEDEIEEIDDRLAEIEIEDEIIILEPVEENPRKQLVFAEKTKQTKISNYFKP